MNSIIIIIAIVLIAYAMRDKKRAKKEEETVSPPPSPEAVPMPPPSSHQEPEKGGKLYDIVRALFLDDEEDEEADEAEETAPFLSGERSAALPMTPPPAPETPSLQRELLSTDTAISMRHYHSTLRPSDYILRRKAETRTHSVRPAVTTHSGPSRGYRLLHTDDPEKTLREAIILTEILQRPYH